MDNQFKSSHGDCSLETRSGGRVYLDLHISGIRKFVRLASEPKHCTLESESSFAWPQNQNTLHMLSVYKHTGVSRRSCSSSDGRERETGVRRLRKEGVFAGANVHVCTLSHQPGGGGGAKSGVHRLGVL